jgi:hypothetical protein
MIGSSMMLFIVVLFLSRLVDGASGGPSGSPLVIDGKKDKIVLLKGRARVDSNVSINVP